MLKRLGPLGPTHPMFDAGHPPQCQCQCFLCRFAFLLADHLGRAQAPKAHSLGVFTSVIVIICVGALVVTVQAKVSTGLCRGCNSLIQSSAPLASWRPGVRPIPVSLVSWPEKMRTGHSSKDSVPLAIAWLHWTSLP
jgi:hypothetical protein